MWVSVVCVSWFVMWSTVEKGFFSSEILSRIYACVSNVCVRVPCVS